MPRYVDGYVLPVPTKNLDTYRAIARKASKVWRDHGALEYVECVADDVKMGCTCRRCSAIEIRPLEELPMKFVCLGYIEQGKFENMPEGERNAAVDACLGYDDVLRRNGHFVGGDGLHPASTAVTLRYSGGKVTATDGPYAETKEQIGGILVLEADSIEHAVELMSKHPGVRMGPFEIRPAADLTGMIQESERRRRGQ